MKRSTALKFLEEELDHQNRKWKRADGDWPSTVWRKNTVLAEEFGEISIALNDQDVCNIVDELWDTAATCIAWAMSDFDEEGFPLPKTVEEVMA